MIIQILLTTMLLLLGLFVACHQGASRGVRMAVLFMLAIGLYLVWQPDEANAVARLLGVGRGADLLLYLWILITLSLILLLYLKILAMDRVLTEVARRLTLLHPIAPEVWNDRSGRKTDTGTEG